MLAKKSLGQNFLMHRQTANRIVAAASLPGGAAVLEIGPGTGMLTRELLSAGHQVTAVEADYLLVETLTETFSKEIEEGKLVLISADIRNFDTKDVPDPYHVVANIPYYITGELLRTFLTAPHQPKSMTFLVQKEVAERIARQKGKTAKESLLSLSVKAFGTPKYCFTVPRGAFMPAPNVDSAVLHIADIGRGSFEDLQEEDRFFEVLRAGFAHKRKRLAKNLEEHWPRESIEAAFLAEGLQPDVRAEDLSLASWIALAKRMKDSSTSTD